MFYSKRKKRAFALAVTILLCAMAFTGCVNNDSAEHSADSQAGINIVFEKSEMGNKAKITAYGQNENTMWEYETPEYEATELSRVGEIGQKDTRYFFVQDGAVVALDVQTGKLLWENSDFGGSLTYAVFGENAIYICGRYGPDFYAVSLDGDTLTKIESFDPDCFWATEIKLIGEQAAVYLCGGSASYDNPKAYYVDLNTYAVSTELVFEGDEAWKDAYVQYINDNRGNSDESIIDMDLGLFKLINIDGDEIPELYICSGFGYTGDYICTYANGEVQSQYLSEYSLAYAEGENIFLDSNGRMGGYHDIVYSIVDGCFTELGRGEYWEEQVASQTAEGDMQFMYFWNMELVSEDEYNEKLDSALDGRSTVRLRESDCCDYEGIVEMIYNF